MPYRVTQIDATPHGTTSSFDTDHDTALSAMAEITRRIADISNSRFLTVLEFGAYPSWNLTPRILGRWFWDFPPPDSKTTLLLTHTEE